jgi:hypothetical protein
LQERNRTDKNVHMKKIQLKNFAALIFAAAILIAGCKKDDKTPEPSAPGGNNQPEEVQASKYVMKDSRNIYHVSNLPGDATSGGGTPIYYSLVTHDVVDSSKRLTDEWDISFANIYNSFVTANNHLKSTPPGPEGTGNAALVLVKKSFDQVTEAPSDGEFEASESYAAWDGFPASHIGWYNYELDTHIMRAIAGRTIVIRTAKGKYAKLEMISLYKDNPENPMATSPRPYIYCRYWIQEDGSRNLAIP